MTLTGRVIVLFCFADDPIKPAGLMRDHAKRSLIAMNVSGQTRMQVMDIIDRMARYYSKRDTAGLMDLIDRDFCGVGSGADEVVQGKEAFENQVKRDFAQCEALTMRLSDVTIYAEGTIAWFMATCVIIPVMNGKMCPITGRMTGVLRGIGHTWLFSQTHFSVPDTRQAPGESYPST